MSNMKRQPIQVRKFRVDPLLSEGLLPVPHEGGDLERKVAAGLFQLAGIAGQFADEDAERRGKLAGEQAGLAGRANVSIDPGQAGQPGQAGAAGDAEGTGVWLVEQLQRDLKISPAAAAGIAGNLDHESGGFKHLQELNPVVPGSRGGGGWAQWTGPRRKQFESWAAQQGLDPSQRQANYGFLLHELQNTPEGNVLGSLQGAATPQEAAKIFSEGFLRPGIPHMESRVARAQKYFSAATDAHQRLTGRGELSPPPSGAATAGVEPSVQAPKITMTGGGFRPTGRNTIAGRAYDAAGTRTYLQSLNLEIEETTLQLYDRFKDDPQALTQAFGDLKREQLKNHVFPEIQAEYELTFDRAAGRLALQAGRGLEQKREEENRAGYLARTGELETMRARKLAAMDPDLPMVASEIAAIDTQLEEHYDAAVAHGILTAPQAELAKQDSRRKTAVGFYLRQADGQSVEDIAALRTEMEAEFAAGQLDGVDAEGWDAIKSGLAARERQAAGDNRAAETALRSRGADFLGRVGAGLDIDPAEIARFQLDANTAPGGDVIVRQTLDLIGVAAKLRDLPVSEAEKAVRDMRAGLNEKSSASEVATVEAAEQMLAQARQRLATDPLSYGEAMRVIEPTPAMSEAGSAADMATLMTERVTAAEKVSDHFGVAPRYLKAGEAKALAAAVKADPEQGAQIAGAIVAGAGVRAANVLAEFGADAPVIAEAGSILADGGSAAAAQDAVRGYSKDAKVKMKPAAEKQIYNREVGDALQMQSRDATRIARAASAITRARLTDDAIEPDSEEADEIYLQALNEAAGAVYQDGVQYGGFASYSTGFFSSTRVLAPNIIRADRFDDVVASVRNEDLTIKPVDGVARLRGLTPVAMRGGYAFHDGDAENPRFAQGEDGALFILDIEALAPVIAPRVPQAWRYRP